MFRQSTSLRLSDCSAGAGQAGPPEGGAVQPPPPPGPPCLHQPGPHPMAAGYTAPGYGGRRAGVVCCQEGRRGRRAGGGRST